jgi:protein-disulfide isomerase
LFVFALLILKKLSNADTSMADLLKLSVEQITNTGFSPIRTQGSHMQYAANRPPPATTATTYNSTTTTNGSSLITGDT